ELTCSPLEDLGVLSPALLFYQPIVTIDLRPSWKARPSSSIGCNMHWTAIDPQSISHQHDIGKSAQCALSLPSPFREMHALAQQLAEHCIRHQNLPFEASYVIRKTDGPRDAAAPLPRCGVRTCNRGVRLVTVMPSKLSR